MIDIEQKIDTEISTATENIDNARYSNISEIVDTDLITVEVKSFFLNSVLWDCESQIQIELIDFLYDNYKYD